MKILKDGDEWYFWDTISNETKWDRLKDIDDATFEEGKGLRK